MGRLHGRGLDLLAVRIQQPAEVAQDPVGGLLGIRTQPSGLVEEVGDRFGGGEQGGVIAAQPQFRREPGAAAGRQLGQRGPQPLHPGAVDRQGLQIGLREVAVVVRVLLAPLRDGLTLGVVPAARLLGQGSTTFQHPRLALDLELDGTVDGPEGVHVLDLYLGAELGPPSLAQRDVGVAPELPRLHVAVVDSQVLQDRTQPHHVLARLVGAAKLGFAHDLHQGHTSAVEVHERALRLVDGALVEQLAGVLLQMGPRDAAAPRLAIDLELEVALAAERQVILRDLVTLGQVRIEVVLTVELGEFRDLAAERQPGPDGLLHGAPVDHRQRPWERQADGAGVGVGRSREVVRGAAAEHLALGQDLGVHLEPDHHLVARCDGHQAAASISGERSLLKPAAVSKA